MGCTSSSSNSRNATRTHTFWFRNPAHEEIAFTYEQKRNAREEITFAHEEKQNAHEEIAFSREEKRNAREEITFAHEEKQNAREEIAFPQTPSWRYGLGRQAAAPNCAADKLSIGTRSFSYWERLRRG